MLVKPLYQLSGFLFLALAIVGIFLPLLPTTPFLLLSAACFARSSEKWYAWLLSNETFGPMIKNWQTHRCITAKTKFVAISSMLVVGGSSIIFAIDDRSWQIGGGLLMLLGLVAVLSIRTCAKPTGGPV